MELSKKTTILFTPEQHAHLARTARRRRTSVGDLIRKACEAQYGLQSDSDRLSAVAALGALELPVSTPAQMKRESLPPPDSLLP